MLRALAIAVVAAGVLAPAAMPGQKTGFAFGRTGGSIRPFTVVIGIDGRVRATGAVAIARVRLTRPQLGELNRLAAISRFGTLPPRTTCPRTLPDVAQTFIRVGPRTVHVRGACLPEYQRLWKALARAVRVSG
jgi:hypothetical protein